jgi:hypothetical protein
MTTTTAPHTHRFDDDAICERCGRTYADVQAERAASYTAREEAKSNGRGWLDAVAEVNNRIERKNNRRTYYERTGR